MAHWLMKTEPDDYSWDRLVADGETEWTGCPQLSGGSQHAGDEGR